MRTIGVTNRKGGSGKTTTTVNLAAALALGGARVLLVDADPQSHSALSLGVNANSRNGGLYDVLVGNADVRTASRHISDDRFSILSGGRRLVNFERDHARDRTAREALLHALAQAQDDFDFVLIDTPPTLRLLTVCSIIASSHVIVPMPMHFLAMEGLAETVRILRGVRQNFGRTVNLLGVVPTFFAPNVRLSRAVVGDIKRTLGERAVLHPIRSNVALAEAPGHGRSIFRHAPHGNGAADYLSLAQQIQTALKQKKQAETRNE